MTPGSDVHGASAVHGPGPMRVPRLLRWVAIAIAVAAVVDPALTRTHRSSAVIAVVPADPRAHAELATSVARELHDAFTIVHAPFEAAAATVLVGTSLPAVAHSVVGPAFAVMPQPPGVELNTIESPRQAPLAARVPVTAALHVRRAGTMTVSLQWDGAVMDRVVIAAAAGERVRVPLHFVPARTGTARLRVTAALAGAPEVTRDVAVDVVDTRWSVLFHDGRPSWMSTFVRRTLEQDARFTVTGRVVTSRDLATEFGRPPARLGDAAALAAYDAVVIGAPETLTAADVAGLDSFLRRRGGAVLLLLDRTAAGPFERLTGTTRWAHVEAGRPLALAAPGDTTALRAAELAWPERLPAAAQPLLRDPAGNPVIWRTAVGAGRLVVSGALDAWRLRDPDSSAFAEFWPALLADLAHAATPPVSAVGPAFTAPGEWATVDVTLRAAALADPAAGPVQATVSMALDAGAMAVADAGAGGVTTARGGAMASSAGAMATDDGAARLLRLWPAGAAGELTATFRAPREPGAYRILVAAADGSTWLPLIVDTAFASSGPDERDLVAAWARSRGGAALPAAQVRELTGLLQQTLRAGATTGPWHPMRSPWWLIPFVAALGGEWWWRRRHGLR